MKKKDEKFRLKLSVPEFLNQKLLTRNSRFSHFLDQSITVKKAALNRISYHLFDKRTLIKLSTN